MPECQTCVVVVGDLACQGRRNAEAVAPSESFARDAGFMDISVRTATEVPGFPYRREGEQPAPAPSYSEYPVVPEFFQGLSGGFRRREQHHRSVEAGRGI